MILIPTCGYFVQKLISLNGIIRKQLISSKLLKLALYERQAIQAGYFSGFEQKWKAYILHEGDYHGPPYHQFPLNHIF